jgi:hypothetical protein
MLTGRRTRRVRLAAGAKTVGWLAAGAAVIAAIMGTALWGPRASAHGVEPAGSIGRDGWIRGQGYEIRLIPNWYALTQTGKPGPMVFTFPFDRATIYLLSHRPASPSTLRNTEMCCSASARARPCLPAHRDCESRVQACPRESWSNGSSPAVPPCT